MRLSLSIDVKGAKRRIETVATRIEDLEQPLRDFGKYLRAKAAVRFKSGGPGWPARKDNGERFTSEGKLRLTKELRAIVAKATPDAQRALKAATRSGGGGALGEAIRQASSGGRIDKALSRIAKQLDRDAKSEQRRSTTPMTAAQAAKAEMRRAKREQKPLLGRIATSLKARVSKRGTLEVYSAIPWAGVHNDGGTAGNNAEQPERRFLELEEDDLLVLAQLIEHHAHAE